METRGRKNPKRAGFTPRTRKLADYTCQTENGSWKNRGLSTAIQDMRETPHKEYKPQFPAINTVQPGHEAFK